MVLCRGGMAAQVTCESANDFLDGYSLVEMMVLCRAARESPSLTQRVLAIPKAFSEANSLLQAMLYNLSLHVPGFREEDIPLYGCVLPLRHSKDCIRAACNPCIQTFASKNPCIPSEAYYNKWCRMYHPGLSDCSLANMFARMNRNLVHDRGFVSFLKLIRNAEARLAPPTEMEPSNPFEPWQNVRVACHPPILLAEFSIDNFTGVVCVRGVVPISDCLMHAW